MRATRQAVRFENRVDAGRQLAARLQTYRSARPIVLALARGGVVVGDEVARALGAPLEVMVARKIGAPGQPELEVGAVAPGVRVVDHRAVRALGVSAGQIERVAAAETAEMERRLRLYRGDRPEPPVRGRTVILVDDGLATGLTGRAAIRSLKQHGPRNIVFAIPVCDTDTAEGLRSEADEVVCAAAPFGFGAVGAWYEHFELTGDSEVLQILARAHARQRPAIADAAASPDVEALAARCAMLAHPLDDAADLDPLLDRIGGARYVLLGEASHGTSDYYVWRARISQRLIREKGFSFIAVEGDWPNCYQVNRYVKGQLYGGGPDAILRTFTRWPTWMWANWEMTAFVDWLRRYNAGQRDERRVGFYGLDAYSLWESLEAVLRYLERLNGGAMETARRAYRCFQPYGEDAQKVARETASLVPASCESEVIAMLIELRQRFAPDRADGRESAFAAEQNALVVKNAEAYYRAMVRGGMASWNVRDRHMADTLDRLMRFHGPGARGIVWQHNSHVGDARAADTPRLGMVNLGQLTRESHALDGVVVVGFASHRGTVVAASEWEAPMQQKPVPPARAGSWEDVLHRTGRPRALYILGDEISSNGLMQARGHRAIGVVYDPEREAGNYAPTVLPRRYDALVYLDETRAVHPLPVETRPDSEPPEMFPWGL